MSKNIDVNIDIGEFNVNEEDVDKETGKFLGDNDKLKFENKEDFQLLLVKPNNIEIFEWSDPNYLNNIMKSDFVSTVKFSPNTFPKNIAENLDIQKYELPDVKVTLIHEEPNYHYELMYLQLLPKYKTKELENQFSLLLQNSGDEKIYGNVLIMKSYVPIENLSSIKIIDTGSNDIINLLNNRINTNVILFDTGDYQEKRLFGPIDKFAETFFDEEDSYKIQKMELPFLKHNINIWFTKFEYGYEGVCGDLLKHLVINKCIVFSLINDNVRGNLSMDEFNKIKLVSTKMDKYNVPEDLMEEEFDDLGRPLLKNKYRILEHVYNKYK